MKMGFVCFICFIELNQSCDLLSHIRVFHSGDKIGEYKCLVDNCSRCFSSLNSFRKHIKIHNNIIHNSGLGTFINLPTDNSTSQSNSGDQPSTSQINEVQLNGQFLNETYFKESVHNECISLISKWYNESVIPKNKVQTLINDISSMQENNINILKNNVLHCK